jgi:hypothetical protein
MLTAYCCKRGDCVLLFGAGTRGWYKSLVQGAVGVDRFNGVDGVSGTKAGQHGFQCSLLSLFLCVSCCSFVSASSVIWTV